MKIIENAFIENENAFSILLFCSGYIVMAIEKINHFTGGIYL